VVAARPYSEGRAARVLVAVSTVSLIAIVAGYIAIIRSQGAPPPDNVVTVPFVAGYLLTMAVLLAVSLAEGPGIVRLRPALRGAAAAGLLVLGFIAAFSIGVPVLITGGLATGATVLALTARPSFKATLSAVVAAIVSVVVLGVGFQISWQTIVCPATGQSGGTTASVFTPGKTYECNDGVLTITSQ
jgi:hypothetical protein